MISVFFIMINAALDACMDILSHHYFKSIFSKKDKPKWNQFINPEYSWRKKYVDDDPKNGRVYWVKWKFIKIKKPVQITDAWHFIKMLKIIVLCLAIVSFNMDEFMINNNEPTLISYFIVFALHGVFWNITFSQFYDHILRND